MSIEIDYSKTVFVAIEPPARIISVYHINDLAEHQKLANEVKTKGLCLYRADIKLSNGKNYVVQPWLLDRLAISDKTIAVDQTKTDDLLCPICTKKMSSQSGLSLHMKSKHARVGKADDSIDITEAKHNQIKCPFCDKIMTSTPGRTLHVKNKHRDRLDEYLRKFCG